MRNFFYKKLFYYHYQLPDKPTKFFLKKVFKARTLFPTAVKRLMLRLHIFLLKHFVCQFLATRRTWRLSLLSLTIFNHIVFLLICSSSEDIHLTLFSLFLELISFKSNFPLPRHITFY